MEKKRKRKEKKEVKEDIYEIFEVDKDGKEKIIKKHKVIEEKEKEPSKEQIRKEKKIFRDIIIIMIGLVLIFVAGYGIIYFTNHFEVEGVKFEVVKMGELTLYRTSLPGIINESGAFVPGNYESGEKAEYNFWLRTDPRKLEKIPFYGILYLKKENVINLTQDLNCGGDGVIAIANLVKLYEIIGANIIKDENAGCDNLGRYGFINILEGNETRVERFGPACFNLYVNNCEILDSTERLMLETLIEVNKKIKESE